MEILALLILSTLLLMVVVVRRYMWLKQYVAQLEEMRERVRKSTDLIPCKESVPVVAVERFMAYMANPDPTFDPAQIIVQERANQLSYSLLDKKD